jgi:ABC-type Fe3+/spermidine/putrescine transport system ATPase subunit
VSLGKIVQVDVAEDLYDHPDNEFVARFIGRANLLDGRLTSVDGGRVTVDVVGQIIVVTAAHDDCKAGDAVRVMVRPERIALTCDGMQGVSGIVKSRTFLGEKTEYHVAVGEHTIQATLFGQRRSSAFSCGDSVQVSFPAEDVHLIRP